ncbi:MAG: RNA 2',3'-cyclic phosphodiesterase [Archangium sp.]
MSAFVAIDLSASARAQARALIDAIRPRFEAKWLPAEKLHVTVLFLGNPDLPRIETLKPLIDSLASRHSSFQLRLRGAGTFVTARAPSVLWLGIDGDLAPLQALHVDATTALGPHDAREYRPHLTLARAHTDNFFEPLSEELRDFEGSPFVVDGLTLYESTHQRYHVLHRAPFVR